MMAFYVAQREDGHVKMGYSKNDRGSFERCEDHMTMGPLRVIYEAPDADRDFERMMFEHFQDSRLVDPGTIGSRARRYEVFRVTPKMKRFLKGKAARELGFRRVGKWLREQETAKHWLLRCVAYGCKQADFALSEEKRLCQVVPKEARGGWVLWEALCGGINRSVGRQLAFNGPGFEWHGIIQDKLRGCAVHVLTYRGTPFYFPVFAEAYERMGKRPPKEALRVGIVPRNRYIESGRRGIPLKKKPEPRPVVRRNPNQGELFT